MINLRLTEYEIELIKESLLSNSLRYINSSNEKKEELGNDWAKKMLEKSSDMVNLINKIKKSK